MANIKAFLLRYFPPFIAEIFLGLTFDGYVPKTTNLIRNEYDYIIVGAGSAGSTLAARLSEVSCVSVLLLEAGGDPPPLSEVPIASRFLWDTDIDWQFQMEPQKHSGYLLEKRVVPFPQGKGLGGGSILNAKLFVRGNKHDYDRWEQEEGCTGWGYDSVLKYFLKMEDNRNQDVVRKNPGYHNTSGPMTIERPRYKSEIKKPLIKALKELGYKKVDINAATQTGLYDQQGTLRDGKRCSTAKGYLVPAQDRKNLDIVKNAYVTKVEIQSQTAVGVHVKIGGARRYVKARKEVILSAGAIKSPQILMLSGIGPKETLEKFNIEVKADLPVGLNFQDHPTVFMNFELGPQVPSVVAKIANPLTFLQWIFFGSGILGSTENISLLPFLKGLEVRPKDDNPTYTLYFGESAEYSARQLGLTEEAHETVYGYYEDKPFYWCGVSVLRPKSRGYVTLRSSDPEDQPKFDAEYFKEESDVDEIVEGMNTCLRVGHSRVMRDKVGSRVFRTKIPGCDDRNFTRYSDEYLRCFAKSIPGSLSHPAGTVRMGDPSKPTTVLDPTLKVKNIRNLRVADASIMPNVVSGNLMIPCIMIGEKAADMIKDDLGQCPPPPPNDESTSILDPFHLFTK